MTDVPLPALNMWIFAGAGLGTLLTWMIMRVAGKNAYQHGFDHGRMEAEGELIERLRASEQARAQLSAALERLEQERRQDSGLPRLGNGTPEQPPSDLPRG
jgi:hypothetical protein